MHWGSKEHARLRHLGLLGSDDEDEAEPECLAKGDSRLQVHQLSWVKEYSQACKVQYSVACEGCVCRHTTLLTYLLFRSASKDITLAVCAFLGPLCAGFVASVRY